ncbi:hypothetical protein H257_13903 [Aphanomyces astaci]|uniref:Uncharacterized protein n=1 Tax=Aphanomyces astaci TaxID=112090 RepID=W4FUM4_APHAT|nr:hypothetical protein H257_13903 [Aphanomyces astaci]ETV70509.1 hypothetical protein H257_13903 [Aphanomyces astaci]|eukprot:XP_009839892.1 hypothetical protein H257_13903 [Aphanomyces astaci]
MTGSPSSNPSIIPMCQFNRCLSPAIHHGKCDYHRMRSGCMVKHCPNQVYARKLCVKHGGKRQCQADGCDANARRHGFCCKHGQKPAKKPCLVEGCVKFAHSRRFCAAHCGSRSHTYNDIFLDPSTAAVLSSTRCKVHGDHWNGDAVPTGFVAMLAVDNVDSHSSVADEDDASFVGACWGDGLDKGWQVESVDLTCEDAMILEFLLM